MAYNLHNRSFLKEIDFQPRELRYLLQEGRAFVSSTPDPHEGRFA